MLDDMGDWQHDLSVGHLAYYLSRHAAAETWSAAEWPEPQVVQGWIDAEWSDVQHLRMVQRWLEEALEAVEEVPSTGWKAYVRSCADLTDRHLTSAVARHLARTMRRVSSYLDAG